MNSKAIVTAVRTARGWDVARWAPIPLRLGVGYGFLVHGYAKLVKGPDVFAGILHAIGVPAPHLMAWLTILIEVLGGVAVLLGAFVPLVSVPMAAVLVVGMVTVHLPGPPPVRVQLDQADRRHHCRSRVRAARLRNRPAVSGLPGRSRRGRLRAARDRRGYCETGKRDDGRAAA